MFWNRKLTCAFVACLVAIQVSGNALEESAAVTGTVTYRERIALAADAVIEVMLQDVSLQDTRAKIATEVTIKPAGKQPPYSFRLQYKESDIDSSHTYVVRASARVKGSLIFTSTMSTPVITRGSPKEVAIVMQHVASAPGSTASSKNVPLESTEWAVDEVAGKPALARQNAPLPSLMLKGGRLTGSSGCNRLFGGYELDGDSLKLSPMGMTRMACQPEVMEQEQALMRAFEQAKTYSIVEDTLKLMNGDTILARFKKSKTVK